eukprot:8979488-Pyramimonas_sp.AAC.1
MPPRRPNMHPRRPNMASRWPKRPPKVVTYYGICFFSAFLRLKTAQEAPNIAHEASKMAP